MFFKEKPAGRSRRMRRFVQATLLGIHRTLLYKKMKK
jgi:hypothetical protein